MGLGMRSSLSPLHHLPLHHYTPWGHIVDPETDGSYPASMLFCDERSRTVAAIINGVALSKSAFITSFCLFWCQDHIQILFSFSVWEGFFSVNSLWTSVCLLNFLLCYSVENTLSPFLVYFVCFMLSDCWDQWKQAHTDLGLGLCGWLRMFVTFMVLQKLKGWPALYPPSKDRCVMCLPDHAQLCAFGILP